MAGLKSLINLLRVLTPEESEITSKYLQSFHRWGQNAAVKLVRLYEVLINNIESPLNENEVIFLIYGESKVEAFDKLVIRLRDKVLESLLLDVNIHREGKYAERIKSLYDIRKRISFAQIMTARGQSGIAIYLLNYAIDDAKKYEFFDELLIAQKLLMGILSISKGAKEYKRQMEIFRSYVRCREAVERAQFAYHDYCVCDAFKVEGESAIASLQKTIGEINKEHSTTRVATAKYYLYYLKTYLYQRQKDFKKQQKTFLALNELIDESVSVFSEQRKSLALINLAECEIRLFNFDQAYTYALKAEKLQASENFNMGQCKEYRALSLYYNGKFDDAEILLEELLIQYPAVESGDFHVGRRLYMKACCLFMKKQFQEAYAILMELNPIEADAEGWNVGMRIMLILTLIEMRALDVASNSTKQLYEHLNKLSKEKELLPRTKIISQVLWKLSKKGFQYGQVYPSIKEKIEQLESGNEEMKWRPITPEMIPIHLWFNEKMFKQPIFPFTKNGIVKKQLERLNVSNNL